MTTFFYNSGSILKHPAGPRKLKGGRKQGERKTEQSSSPRVEDMESNITSKEI